MAARLRGWWQGLQDSLWFVPALFVVGALVIAWAAVALEPLPGWFPSGLVYSGSPEGARSVLSELAGGTITVVGLVFSLTVVALQMASSQFSPRLLRTFLRDRATQVVLGGMVGTAVYDITVLRTVRSAGEGGAFVPSLAVTLALGASLGAVGLLVFFLHHVTQHLRVDVLLMRIARETQRQLDRLDDDRDVIPDQDVTEPPPTARVLTARTSGYLLTVLPDALASQADAGGWAVLLRPSLGTWVTAGTTLAWVWPTDPSSPVDLDDAGGYVHASLHLGSDRTEVGDIAFGVRQIVDIGTRALSPGVNDPSTAVQAIEHLGNVLVTAAAQPLGAQRRVVDDVERVIVPRPTFPAMLSLAVDQVRHYGAGDVDVLVALCRMLTDLAEVTADHADRLGAVEGHLDRVVAASELTDTGDQWRLERAASAARTALSEGSRPVTPTEAS